MPQQVYSFWLRPAEAPEGVPLSMIQPVWTLPVERAVAVPELPAFPPPRPLACTHSHCSSMDTGLGSRAGHPLPWPPDVSRSQELGCAQTQETKAASAAQDSRASSKWGRRVGEEPATHPFGCMN